MAEVRNEVTRVTDLYGAKGYAFAEVNPDIRPDQDAKTAVVVFDTKEGALIHVRNINITGNEKTRDKVIRRELRLNEAELIDTAALKRSFQRLNNLNYFETVEIIPKQLDPNTVDLDVKIKEKSTGTFSVGGGVTTTTPVDQLPILIQQQLGTTTTNALVLGLSRDTRDFYADPTSGARHALTTELAFSGLGANNEFYKVIGDTAWFFPVIGDTVFAPRARVGVAHSYGSLPLPVGERFFVGGIQTVRGFSFGRAGPVFTDGSPLGATKQVLFNFDYIFPLVPEVKVKGVLFFD